MTVLALLEVGEYNISKHFFKFCNDVIEPDGYLMHKYRADRSLGSSWHPFVRDGKPILPIQEDETALVLHALWKHFEVVQDFEFLQEMYERLVKRAAQFLCDFREEGTGLPLPSYDPWEEHRGVFTYTTCCTIAGLTAASRIAHILGHYRHSERYQLAADAMRQALLFHLYDEESGRFLKKIKRKGGMTVERDATPDASIGVIWSLGILSPDDPRVVSTMTQLHDRLAVREGIGGLARYTIDFYHAAVTPSERIPGNPWVITTLWDAQWRIARARTAADLDRPRETLLWAVARANAAGILPEQMHPLTGAPLSVAPLTWSHAVFVDTVLQFAEKEKELARKKEI
jgi:GH15 family glucan-1,4-alpha-glucosidase